MLFVVENFLAQARAADLILTELIKKKEEEGYKQELPGVWVLRDEQGRIVATMGA